MREILFRGKAIDGNWYYGVPLIFTEDYVCMTAPHTYNKKVEANTIGQFTGLTDKNGTKIFEGDIVKLTDVNNDIKWNAIIVFGNPYGEYCWGWNLMYIGANPKVNTDILCWVDMEESGAFIEVIGNMYDNPELLKGGEE